MSRRRQEVSSGARYASSMPPATTQAAPTSNNLVGRSPRTGMATTIANSGVDAARDDVRATPMRATPVKRTRRASPGARKPASKNGAILQVHRRSRGIVTRTTVQMNPAVTVTETTAAASGVALCRARRRNTPENPNPSAAASANRGTGVSTPGLYAEAGSSGGEWRYNAPHGGGVPGGALPGGPESGDRHGVSVVSQPLYGLRASVHVLLCARVRAPCRSALGRALRPIDPGQGQHRRGSEKGVGPAELEARGGRYR